MFHLIAAVDRKLGIAKAGVLPWYIPDDEAYFTRQTKTLGGINVMGSKTLEMMGKPLAERANYVLTSRSDLGIEGAEIVHDIDEFITQFQDHDVWVIGGAEVFRHVMERGKADVLYLTHIDADFNCDRFFPKFSDEHYELAERSEPKEENGFNYHYAVYKKR